MVQAVTFILVRSVFGAVLGMFYFGFNTGVVNAPEAAIRDFCNTSYHQHYGTFLDQNTSDIIFTVITSAFIVGGMLGAMVGGMVADKLGRKKGLILSQVMGWWAGSPWPRPGPSWPGRSCWWGGWWWGSRRASTRSWSLSTSVRSRPSNSEEL